MKKIPIILLFFILSNLALSQIIKLDLKRSISIASDSSLQAFRAKNLYMASYWEYRAFKAGRLPSMSLKTTPIQYQRDFTKRYDSDRNVDVYREQQSLYTYGNLSISQNLDFTGGTFFVDSELGYMRNLGDNTFSQFSTVPIRIGYSQALFGFNSFKWDKKIEPLKYEKAKKQYLYSREEVSESVITYFFSLAMAQMEYNMAIENVASSDTLYNMGQERHKIASISQSDLLTLKLDVVNARNTLKNSEMGLKRSMFSFVSFLNMNKETQIQLELPDRPVELTIPMDAALLYARENNPDYLGFMQEELNMEKEVDRTKKSAVFDASFSVSVGFNQIAENFGDSYKNPLQQDLISVSFTIPLIDWGVRKGRANMARNNLNVTKISIQQKALSLEQDIIMTVNDFNIQQNLISSAEEALKLSTMAYNATKERFIIGKADLNSMTLSLNRQNTAQRNYISTCRDYWLSYYKLRKLTLFDFFEQKKLTELFDVTENVRP
ncbi:TolC family protein [Dysgonomonas macrotermitis]|uniref:Outer membrane efflux protein n=1 Tax=Dysgonomonas macrotermitis TaxID=1346286 RepID=A0A1M4WKA9_9BACT|nr:TolC family protein [Dysgonomonas macrotermitis]SHE81668.1 Outer membrane efflux protein [Dysgonomonas macrotermitis]